MFHNGMGVKAQKVTLKLDHGLLNYFCAVIISRAFSQALSASSLKLFHDVKASGCRNAFRGCPLLLA